MPSIEISQEQAEALARGEHVSLAPPEAKAYIVRTDMNNIWLVKTRERLNLEDFFHFTDGILLEAGGHPSLPGYIQDSVRAKLKSFQEVTV